MAIRMWKFFLMTSLIHFTVSATAENIVIERYENWHHPVLSIFKKYGISLYKVSYSKDGKCPTFYAKFKYDPDPRAPSSDLYYDKVYAELLKANSYFPYALVYKESNLKINVGYVTKVKTRMIVNLDKASSPSLCKDGTVNPDSEKFTVTPQMKEHIKSSSFKASLRRRDGKEFIAYLYAEDEEHVTFEYISCSDGKKVKTNKKRGHYYIYLYDPRLDSFFPSRTAVLTNHYTINMDIEGADFFTLSGANQNESDVLLVSQRGGCSGSFYEVYGFWDDQVSLTQYTFVGLDGEDKIYQFQGQIDKSKPYHDGLMTYITDDKKNSQFVLSTSKIPNEVQMKPLKNM